MIKVLYSDPPLVYWRKIFNEEEYGEPYQKGEWERVRHAIGFFYGRLCRFTLMVKRGHTHLKIEPIGEEKKGRENEEFQRVIKSSAY